MRQTPRAPASRAPATPDHVWEMMSRYLEPTIMAGFDDDDVTEIYLNPQDTCIRFETRSRGKVETGVSLERGRVEMFLNAVASAHSLTLNATTPSLQAELPDAQFRGSRLQGFLPPLTSGPCFVIRKPPRSVYTLTEYVQKGLLSDAHYLSLCDSIDARHNLLVIGGTNTGKTTFANALLYEIAMRHPSDRLLILEDTIELRCTARDVLALRTTAHVSLAQLVKMTLRASPTRIIVGEVRDAAALDLMDAWATGHPGGIATFHATDARGALLRLDRLAQRANVPSQVALIAEAVHRIVVMANSANGRHVTDLVRVESLTSEGHFHLQHCTAEGTWE